MGSRRSFLAVLFLSFYVGSPLVIPCNAVDPAATPIESIRVADGFSVELVHTVDGKGSEDNPAEGSWVAITVDPKGRLIASDQGGGLFRLDVSVTPAKVEKLDTPIVGAQGLLCAFGSLYANINLGEPSGLWRLTDTDGDDQYDQFDHLIKLKAGGEHGPHGLVLSPEGQRIVMCVGNKSIVPDLQHSRSPRDWGEDQLLPRMPDARGHAAGTMAPGGYILSLKADGTDREMVCNGFRNPYDLAYNRDGELFTYDSDMEWDIGTPWYRPTRILHCISGADFGWRNGTGKWPAYYPDSFGSVADIGPGSPTGICFGYGAKFPAKYQNAMFACDWSYGNIYVVHFTPDGSSYSGKSEVFASAAPLPVTDITIHPDGAMYFAMGGRETQSAVYRIQYTGDDSTELAGKTEVPSGETATLRKTRHRLENLHSGATSKDDQANTKQLTEILDSLDHPDRGIRVAARVALQHTPIAVWKGRLAELKTPRSKILAVITLARNGETTDKELALQTLASIDWPLLNNQLKIDYLRAIGLVTIRMDGVAGKEAELIVDRLSKTFPTGENGIDRELARLLVYLDDPTIVPRIVKELKSSPDQENQIHFALVLREAKSGWTEELYRDYFRWFVDIKNASGGLSFGGFIDNIKMSAVENLSDLLKESLADAINAKPISNESKVAKREFVKSWKTESLTSAVGEVAAVPSFQRGKELFIAGACYGCHRIGMQGGILGPDLTGAGGRFNTHDLIQAIVDPSKVISDQYGAKQFLTYDGDIIVGKVVNMRGTELRVMTNMLDPSALKTVDTQNVEITQDATVSMMPGSLLDTFTAEEVWQLLTYLKAGGNKNHPTYQNTVVKQ